MACDSLSFRTNTSFFYVRLWLCGASLVVQRLKRLPAMQETWVRSLGWEDPPEKEMATHSSIIAWRIPWVEEPGGLQYTRSQRVCHIRNFPASPNFVLHIFSLFLFICRVFCLLVRFLFSFKEKEVTYLVISTLGTIRVNEMRMSYSLMLQSRKLCPIA